MPHIRMILNRVTPLLKQHIIKEQSGFRTGKSCTSQLLNSTHRIWLPERYDYRCSIVDLSAAYDTVNHMILIQKLCNTTQDNRRCRVIQYMLSNRRIYVELNNERSRWRKQKNGVSSHQSCSTYRAYTNDQPHHDGTHSFIYTDDLSVTSQYSSLEVERTIGDVLDKLTQYYRSNSLSANLDTTQVTVFHLRNNEAKRWLKVVWNMTELENTPIRSI